MTWTKVGALLLSGLLVAGASACGGAPDKPARSAADRLAAARRTLDASPSVRVDLSSPDFPAKAEGVTAAKGVVTHQPAFQGSLTVRARGLSGTVDVVSVGGTLRLRLPFTRSYVPARAADYGAPDPADLLSPDKGISSLLGAVQSPALGDRKRDGSAEVQTITGTLPGDQVVDVLAAGQRGATFPVSFQVGDDDRVRSVTVTGPFFPATGATSRYDVRLDGYGEQVTVRAP
ncbi:LppX_LprAFG lipoprotein [Arsenicicoccus dermatophilus]|uniref:LppX_LprAFG lipoprotein n=1 Tax=Arsenicicoccus dermatophilus TaxID=1076331 RepID=UPI001F4D3250|nr:LppX_LprAFG lipoprotein [Arsenicicoccus dermatophilus]MCH8611857.1 LppX_LprAFG lipoprotein [Arsenicicoccus dermatophilus]